jgi:hypothetical protein
MKMSSALLGSLILWLWSVPNYGTGPGKTAETVTIRLVDYFGVPWPNCHVAEFTSTLGRNVGSDYAGRFRGLTGRDIPINVGYRLVLQCAKPDYPSPPFSVDVTRDRTLIVVSSWMHRGDYETGLGPRLTVSVVPRPPEVGQAWVRLLGVYMEHSASDGVDPQTGEAQFHWMVVPGTYMVLLLTPEKLVCAKEIQLLEPHGRLELQPKANGCAAKGLASVKVIE